MSASRLHFHLDLAEKARGPFARTCLIGVYVDASTVDAKHTQIMSRSVHPDHTAPLFIVILTMHALIGSRPHMPAQSPPQTSHNPMPDPLPDHTSSYQSSPASQIPTVPIPKKLRFKINLNLNHKTSFPESPR
jgi:hypothetical protein